jgi:hypothetical protein
MLSNAPNLVSRIALSRSASLLWMTSLLAAPLLLAGCLEPGDLTVVPGISQYKASGAYVRVSKGAYDSDLSSDTRIDVWVSRDAAEQYRRIAPEAHGSGATLPYGTVIIREVHDKKTAKLLKLTMMYKGAPGVAPEIGDWQYAVTDAVGVPLLNDDGSEKKGDMPECRGCHEERGAQDDFLFGVPEDARAEGVSASAVE